MDFYQVAGSRRSIRWFKTWETIPKETVQRILEVTRVTTCPGNLEPWRAIVVYRDELDEASREELLKADNWQGAHVQAPVWIYFYGDPDQAQKDCFINKTYNLIEWGALPTAYGWNRETIKAAITEGVETPEGMAGIH